MDEISVEAIRDTTFLLVEVWDIAATLKFDDVAQDFCVLGLPYLVSGMMMLLNGLLLHVLVAHLEIFLTGTALLYCYPFSVFDFVFYRKPKIENSCVSCACRVISLIFVFPFQVWELKSCYRKSCSPSHICCINQVSCLILISRFLLLLVCLSLKFLFL